MENNGVPNENKAILKKRILAVALILILLATLGMGFAILGKSVQNKMADGTQYTQPSGNTQVTFLDLFNTAAPQKPFRVHPNAKIIKCYPGFRNKAFTIGFDDGPVQDPRLIGIMKNHNIKGTFFINSGLFGAVGEMTYDHDKIQRHERLTAQDSLEAYQDVEVGIHTLSHINVTLITPDELHHQVVDDKQALEKLFNRSIKGMAYPGGFHDQRTADLIRSYGVSYARTVINTEKFDLPKDFLQWDPTCHFLDAKKYVVPFLEEGGKDLKLFAVWGHSYELDRKDGAWDEFDKFCGSIGGKQNIWYATNGEVCQYINAFNALTFVDGRPVNNSGIPLYLIVDGQNVVV